MIRALLIHPQFAHNTSSIYLWPFLHAKMGYSDRKGITTENCCITMPLKCSFIPLIVSNLDKLHPIRSFVAQAHESSNVRYDEGRGEVGVNCQVSEPALTKEHKEAQRRLRIGLANKGKVPWNKGKKHTVETCARIKERTLEALRDPKVRKRMSQSSHLHSEESKRKIGSSLKKLWAQRLQLKHSKELFYSSWADSLAEAAKIGGVDEEQLDWDSYERLKVEMAFQRFQLDEEKAQEKEKKRIRAEKKVQERKRKKNAELRDKKKRKKSSKTRVEKDGLAASSEISITDRLTKILAKKSADGPSNPGVMLFLQSALEKFDIESIKAERRRNTVSLADQIQAAKNKRSEMVTSGSTMTITSPTTVSTMRKP
ncbi:uncharacterized protein LOC130820145 isoform X2 [Amaranthus tricolor]|uniref:uncharacterized protein LOC130820145 isoform X2 n=1 Tax=Amaranthus tricolor TaxID=29722 RepID=UPI0025863686|nr:uncharacterized protein LOC130820145 isoform X2 [Amaranthus tricolor]